MKLNKYINHIIELCKRYKIQPVSVKTPFDSCSLAPFKLVFIRPPWNFIEYAIALHEIGHCMSGTLSAHADGGHFEKVFEMFQEMKPTDSEAGFNAFMTKVEDYVRTNIRDKERTQEEKLNDEIAAWNWAQSNALEWNDVMEAARTYGMATHVYSFTHNGEKPSSLTPEIKKAHDDIETLHKSIPKFAPQTSP